jgi:two-component system response regulator AtoC
LRERADDIPLLIAHFCRALGKQNARPNMKLEPAAISWLSRQPWPGNVRQLQNFVERLVVLSENDTIDLGSVQAELNASFEPQTDATVAATPQDLEQTLGSGVIELDAVVRRAEKKAIDRALRKAKGNRTVAARILGVSRRTLYNKMDEHSIE